MLTLNQLNNLSELPDLALCKLENWDLISVVGEDRIKFLQSQLTCDMAALKPGQQTLAAQCTPQGKAWSIFRVIVLEEKILLFQPSSVTEVQLPELQKYAVFSNVEITKDVEYQAIGLAGAQSGQYIEEKFNTNAMAGPSCLCENGIIIKQPYPSLRYLIILKTQQADDVMNGLKDNINIFDDSLWNALNIEAGVGFIEKQTTALFVPQMLNLQALNGISFKKGCYLGQETIARTKSRGINKRALFLLSGHAIETPKVGNNMQVQLNGNWKRIGTVISVGQYADNYIEVLAVLPKDSNSENIYQIQNISDSKLTILPLPYSLKEE